MEDREHLPPATWHRRHTLLTTCACAGLVLFGCQRVGVPAPPAPASVLACPAPALDASGWRLVRDSADVSYRVPSRFTARPDERVPYRTFTDDDGPSGRILIGFSPSREHFTTLRRAPSPPMREMNECIETVGGRDILFQAWRTEGGIFRDGRRHDLFEVLALVPVEPMLTLYVTGGGDGPGFQEILLTVARTVRVGAR